VIRRATIVAVGRLKGWTAEGCDDYLARLRRYFPVEVVEVPEEDMNRRTAEEVLAAEGQRLLKRLPGSTILDVFRHTAGFGYDFFNETYNRLAQEAIEKLRLHVLTQRRNGPRRRKEGGYVNNPLRSWLPLRSLRFTGKAIERLPHRSVTYR
jgi:hypothetical protein